MKKVFALILTLVLVVSLVPALADNGNITLSNTDVSTITINPDEWQGDENYFLVLVQTGITTTKDFEIIIPNGFNAIIECYSLDGVDDGHLVAYAGGQTVKATVTNGLVGLCTAAAGPDLFIERLRILVKNNWAHTDVRPLTTWDLEIIDAPIVK